MHVVTVSGTSSVFAVVLAAAALVVVFTRVVMQVAVSVCGNTASERGFLLEGSSSVRGTRFRFWC